MEIKASTSGRSFVRSIERLSRPKSGLDFLIILEVYHVNDRFMNLSLLLFKLRACVLEPGIPVLASSLSRRG